MSQTGLYTNVQVANSLQRAEVWLSLIGPAAGLRRIDQESERVVGNAAQGARRQMRRDDTKVAE